MKYFLSRIKISPGAVMLIAAAYFFNAFHLSVLVIVAAIIHESGHYAALRLLGARVTRIRLQITGAAMEYSGTLTYAREALAAAAGPIASAALAIAAAGVARHTGIKPAYELSGMSLLYCIFNLLPVLPLDGGKIMYAVLARFLSITTADRVSCAIGCCVILTMLTAGAYILVLTKSNFTLLAGALWLLIYYCKNSDNSIVLI